MSPHYTHAHALTDRFKCQAARCSLKDWNNKLIVVRTNTQMDMSIKPVSMCRVSMRRRMTALPLELYHGSDITYRLSRNRYQPVTGVSPAPLMLLLLRHQVNTTKVIGPFLINGIMQNKIYFYHSNVVRC